MSVVSKDSDHKDCPGFMNVSGVILAGGKSSRYGRNKALVSLKGTPLIEKVIAVMQPLFQELIIITNTPGEYAYLKLPMHEDLIKGLGPIGGIYTGLTAISNDAGFFVACDMPYLNGELIRYMVESSDDFDAVVPKIAGNMEALFSLYRKRCLPAMEGLIESREYQIVRFFHLVSVLYIGEKEVRRFDPDLRSFTNINSPQELGALESQ
ncbi:MAG: molybdenum cofactor guanylyltransferase [Desulfobacterales bacterium]|nr:molybdenum cofactor guanylyltransferase [Desulfobacterales bacterium]